MINERAAAIDIGARVHVAAVDPERCAEPVQTFQAFTGDFSAWHGGSRKWALKQWLWSRPAFIGYPSTRYWKITAWRSCWPTRAKPVPYQAARVMSVMHSGCNVCLPEGDFTPVFAQAGRSRHCEPLCVCGNVTWNTLLLIFSLCKSIDVYESATASRCQRHDGSDRDADDSRHCRQRAEPASAGQDAGRPL